MSNCKNLSIDDLRAVVREAMSDALRCPHLTFRPWVDSEGDTGVDEDVNDSDYDVFRDPDYERYYIASFRFQCFDVVEDWWFDEDEKMAWAFAEKWGVAYVGPVDEDGYELDGDREDLARAAALALGKSAEEIETWLDEEREMAIQDYATDYDSNVVDDFIRENPSLLDKFPKLRER